MLFFLTLNSYHRDAYHLFTNNICMLSPLGFVHKLTASLRHTCLIMLCLNMLTALEKFSSNNQTRLIVIWNANWLICVSCSYSSFSPRHDILSTLKKPFEMVIKLVWGDMFLDERKTQLIKASHYDIMVKMVSVCGSLNRLLCMYAGGMAFCLHKFHSKVDSYSPCR